MSKMGAAKVAHAKLDAAINKLAALRDGWSLMACVAPDEFIGQVADELVTLRAENERLRAELAKLQSDRLALGESQRQVVERLALAESKIRELEAIVAKDQDDAVRDAKTIAELRKLAGETADTLDDLDLEELDSYASSRAQELKPRLRAAEKGGTT